MKNIFGPVNSRRLGLSLGIDLVPFKTCSLDCIYCECGGTTNLTSEIKEYISTDDIIIELKEYLKNKPRLDMLTFSGSGEPTLHSGIEKIIDFLKENYPEYKVSILTNGTLLSYKKVRNSIRNADIILPSLDAVSEELFKRIARPAEGITAKKLITGLIKLRNEFNGKIFIEYFVIPGLNDNIIELELIKNTLLKIKPDLVQLNTLDRPGAEDWISSAGSEKLHKIRSYLKPLRVEIVTDYKKADHNMINKKDEIADALISTIGRRPSTLHDLSVTLGIIPAELLKVIGHLLKNNIIEEENTDRGRFFKLKRV